jgi:hypothetical protein
MHQVRDHEGISGDKEEGKSYVSEGLARRRQAASVLAGPPDCASGFVAEDDRGGRHDEF